MWVRVDECVRVRALVGDNLSVNVHKCLNG